MTCSRSLSIAIGSAVAIGWGAVSYAADSVDVGQTVPDSRTVKEGLFPEDACKELEATGFKCMGFKPAVRYSLPTASFRVGSVELPELLRQQLDVFAKVLRETSGSGRVIRIEGYTDASGPLEVNMTLSKRRADAVRAYLVANGADKDMLDTVGMGPQSPKIAANPFAAENRRVEIVRMPAAEVKN